MKNFKVTFVDDGVLFLAADRSRPDGASLVFEKVDSNGEWVVLYEIHRDNVSDVDSMPDPLQA
jgi:hypothetical protein